MTSADPPSGNDGGVILSDIEAPARTGEVRVWSLSGAGFVIRDGEDVVYIDPWLVPPDATRKTRRYYPPPFPPDAVRKARAVLSTHEHEDHCNVMTLLGISRSSGAVFLGPESSTRKALGSGFPSSRAITVAPGDVREISQSIRLRAFKASDPYEASALMYLLETSRGNIFHSGDSSYFEGFKRVGDAFRVDVALLNFGRQIPTPEKPYYMNAERLSCAARDLGARVVVPMHWNLWAETFEDPHPIERVLRTEAPGSRLDILQGGESLDL